MIYIIYKLTLILVEKIPGIQEIGLYFGSGLTESGMVPFLHERVEVVG